MKKSKSLLKVLTATVVSSLVLASTTFSGSVFAKGGGDKIYMGEMNPEFMKEVSKDKSKLNHNFGYGDIKDKGNLNHNFGYGDIPNPVKITKGMPDKKMPSAMGLPAKFDLRTKNKVTSVKNQGSIGSCWTFATYGSLESWKLINQNISKDYSENNLMTHHGFDNKPNKGGNTFMATAYLSRWDGPVLEKDDPYASPATVDNIVVRDGIKPVSHVQEVLFIPERTGFRDNDQIKKTIMKSGAIYTSIQYNKKYFNDRTNAYYDNNQEGSTNHGVNIVGWDDNYSRNNFNNKPVGDGAFIVKNSWGSNWGDKGYFYISYYDNYIGKNNAAFVNEQSNNNYSKVYQYDPLGMVSRIGYKNKTASFANVFKASLDNEKLSAVSFYTTKENANYEIYVETDYETNGFKKLTKIKSGVIDMPGYHTINLENNVSLNNGKKYAVAVKLTEEGEKYPIAIEMSHPNYSSKASANIGESFVSYDNKNWTDLKQAQPNINANVCLKAFTKIK